MTTKAEITPREARRLRVEAAREAGMCIHCLIVPAREERVTCAECGKKGTASSQRSRAGLAQPRSRSMGNLTQAQAAAKRRYDAVRKGKCSICASQKARKDRYTCQECADRSARHRKKQSPQPAP